MRPPFLLILAGFSCLAPAPGAAQHLTADLSVGASGSAWRSAATFLYQVDVARRAQLGAGVRLTRFGGDHVRYRSVGSRPTGFPTHLDLAPNMWALNLAVAAQLRLHGPLSAGANLDLAGVAAGPTRTAGAVTARPARGSVFLYGNRDRGSLNSEFFLAVRVRNHVGLRVGVSHAVTGYRGTSNSGSARYLRFNTVPFVAVRWTR